MHHSTRKKFNFLTRYVQRNFSRWKKAYPNIVGVHVGKKFTGGRFKNRYSIVFLVEEKLDHPDHPVPHHFDVKFSKTDIKRIPTDVYGVGQFEFRSIALGDRNNRKDLNVGGTVGAFFDKGGHTYACTNMHVLLPDLILSGHTRFYQPVSQQTVANVWLYNRQAQYIEGFLEIALFSSIDAALIRVREADIQSLIRDVGMPTGVVAMNTVSVNMPLEMRGSIAGRQEGMVLRMGVSIHAPPVKGNTLDNLIITSIKSLPGDSGSPVYSKTLHLLGIAIGGTHDTTYVLPLEAIQEKLRYQIKL
jgi:hypothetical protein